MPKELLTVSPNVSLSYLLSEDSLMSALTNSIAADIASRVPSPFDKDFLQSSGLPIRCCLQTATKMYCSTSSGSNRCYASGCVTATSSKIPSQPHTRISRVAVPYFCAAHRLTNPRTPLASSGHPPAIFEQRHRI